MSTPSTTAATGGSSSQALQTVDRLRGQGKPADALQLLLQQPTRCRLHGLLHGSLLLTLGRPRDAATVFLQVLALHPQDLDAYQQLGFALAALRQFGEAAECFRTVLALDPAQLGAAVYAAHFAAWACDWRQAAADQHHLHHAMGLQERSGQQQALSPFCLLAMADDVVLHRRGARLESARLATQILAQAGQVCAQPSAYPAVARALQQGRCRIGLVSADFRTHATGMLLVQTLETLDRSRFELLLYCHSPNDGTALQQRIRAAVDQFIDCTDLSLAAQAQRIHDDGVAVLVDMSGHTSGSRLALFSLRPAPVQAVWLAYPATLGADCIDYLIGDPVTTPTAHAGDFDEHLVQLPVCYAPTDAQRPHPATTASRSDVGLPDSGFVYACFNQSYKISADVFARWCRILQRVPGSVLWLLVPQPAIQASLRQHAVDHRLDPDRLVFAPFADPLDHLARLPLADVFLDTFPYGAHTTCSDALWMGLPVLSQMGRSMASRVAGSLLHAVGLGVLAVDTAADYDEIAVRLAHDSQALADIRDHLRCNRLGLPLFDNTAFSAALGAAFWQMAQRWASGLPPAALSVVLPSAGLATAQA